MAMTKKGSKKTKAAKNENATTAAPVDTKPAAGRKQGELAGFERKRIEELDQAAEAYRTARNSRQEKTKVEKAKKQELMAVARKHGVKVYLYESEDGEELQLEYTAETKENVKVKKIEDVDDEED
jgi:hypothetical protein